MIQDNNKQVKKGMNRNTHPSELEQEYTFAMNANIQSENNGEQVVLQNENSNTLCSRFLDGFIVIKSHYDRVRRRTYFFLLNEKTGCSEIGWIDENQSAEENEAIRKSCGCDDIAVLEDGLETVTDIQASCEYNTLLSDFCEITGECTGCLGFSKTRPIKDVVIRHAVTGDEIYFTDGYTFQKYVNIDRIDELFLRVEPCTGEVEQICLDCEKLRLFRRFDPICTTPLVIQGGGTLKAGSYEVFIAYAEEDGEIISDVISATNPISIFDTNNILIDQTTADYITNQGFSVHLTGLDEDYRYYKVLITYSSENNPAPQYYDYGTFPISTNTVSITHIPEIAGSGRESINENTVIGRRPEYLTAEGMTDAGGYLIQHSLTTRREINLQPVVNLIGTFAKWQTVMSNESLFKDGINSAKYKGYYRDETYPLGLQFLYKGGGSTALFPLISRPSTLFDVDVINNDNVKSIQEGYPECSDVIRDKRWQYENTATKEGVCEGGDATITQPYTEIVECESEPITIGEGTIHENLTGSVVNWINDNVEYILESEEAWLEDIKEALLAEYDECETEFDGDCEEPVLIEEEVIAVSSTGETVSQESVPYEEYDKSVPPSECLMRDESGDMEVAIQDVLWNGAQVYKKAPVANTICVSAATASYYSGTSPTTGHHLVDMLSTTGVAPLLSSTNVSLFDNVEFYDKLHNNAVWFKTSFAPFQKTAIELTSILCNFLDDNSSNKVRITVWEGCPTLTEKPTYARIINDITVANNPDGFLVFDIGDFTGTNPTVYIAIDSPIRERVEVDITFSPLNGTGYFTIGGTNYNVTGGATESAIVDSFISAHNTAFTGAKMKLIDQGNTLRIIMSPAQYASLTFTNTSEDLNATWVVFRNDFMLQPPCGCFSVIKRDVILTGVIKYESITFVKRRVFEYNCAIQVPYIKPGCEATPYEYGKFAYVESIHRYPCNSELYDSSNLEIEEGSLPSSIETEFINTFTQGGAVDPSGNYVLDGTQTNFMDKNIRHFKFPDNDISPFMSTNNATSTSATIYPIGVQIDNEVINFFLDVAVKNELITPEEREDIIGYEVFRGDRRTNRSIFAKGIGFTALEYSGINQSEKVVYPNFPLNQLGVDRINGLKGNSNYNYLTFHSPETLFASTSLGNEVKIEGYLAGKANNTFAPYKDHPSMVLLGQKARTLATTLASLELAAEILSEVADILTWAGTGSGVTIAVSIALGVASVVMVAVNGLFKAGSYRYQWLQTFEGFGQGYNFAYIGISEGFYNSFNKNTQQNSLYRGLDVASYIEAGDIKVKDERGLTDVYINNYNREQSVFFKLTKNYPLIYPPAIANMDKGTREQIAYSNTGVFKSPKNFNTAVPYISMKTFQSGQWGEINSIDWLPTNYCGRLEIDNKCDAVFGGDIYISRLAIKKKFPIFRTTAIGLAMDLPFKYSTYANIRNYNEYMGIQIVPTGYLDYKTDNEEANFASTIFPENKSAYFLYSGDGGTTEHINEFFVTDKWKFLVQYYGIPSFLVESEFNCNYRHGRFELKDQFLPYTNLVDWVQDANLPISEKERFYYNRVYSRTQHKKAYYTLPNDFSRELSDKRNDLSNTLIYSAKDDMSNSLRAPWRNYKALDYATFSKDLGDLVDVEGIESEIVWLRFSDSQAFYNTIDPIRETVVGSASSLGRGHMFSERAVSFNKTDLGHAGTQHKTKISTPYGHYTVDAKRGKVFEIAPNAKGLTEISLSMDKWFKDQLPFKILKYIPNADVDNAYNGCGISMGWDDVTRRVFITKIDYIPTDPSNTFFDTDEGYYILNGTDKLFVDVKDTKHFKDASWTIGYNPITQGWISYYSFTPNYYVSLNEYFQTGVNNLGDKSHGLWSHFPFVSSYQVFYGDLHPFIIEFAESTKATQSNIETISYWMDTRKYTNKYDFSNGFGKSFNKAYIYNDFQNSGRLDLIPQNTNDRSQFRNYPKYTGFSTEILQSEINNKWSFNYLYNVIKNERAMLPVWNHDEVNVNKELDLSLLDLSAKRKDRLRGDYFLVRLVQDQDSRFKHLFRLQSNKVNYYI